MLWAAAQYFSCFLKWDFFDSFLTISRAPHILRARSGARFSGRVAKLLLLAKPNHFINAIIESDFKCIRTRKLQRCFACPFNFTRFIT